MSTEELAAARSNIQRYAWAREERDFVLACCQPWLAMSDKALWELVPGQQVPARRPLGPPSAGPSQTRKM